ncbi:hypothetical protein NRI_0584 [Neorickettsia risticii str. Illinois]|uniref:Uncharacterized protein n=1 Tax=Neorickettsia risticii (strain Illinois) TaxID=434131 RepID=C6V595_NEORI|nr:hypothetical protein NRI_0584 [Neorickettsia risticii str. Illinois]
MIYDFIVVSSKMLLLLTLICGNVTYFCKMRFVVVAQS